MTRVKQSEDTGSSFVLYCAATNKSRVDWPDELSALRATFVFASNRIKIVLMARPRPCGRGRVVMNGLCGINRCSHSDLYQLAASDRLLLWSAAQGKFTTEGDHRWCHCCFFRAVIADGPGVVAQSQGGADSCWLLMMGCFAMIGCHHFVLTASLRQCLKVMIMISFVKQKLITLCVWTLQLGWCWWVCVWRVGVFLFIGGRFFFNGGRFFFKWAVFFSWWTGWQKKFCNPPLTWAGPSDHTQKEWPSGVSLKRALKM